jgi:hypothetical protein
MPDCGPFVETFFEAKLLAIVCALFLKSRGGGKVETVLTVESQPLPDLLLPRADFAAGIQYEFSASRIAADRLDCNTLMLVRDKFSERQHGHRVSSLLEAQRR